LYAWSSFGSWGWLLEYAMLLVLKTLRLISKNSCLFCLVIHVTKNMVTTMLLSVLFGWWWTHDTIADITIAAVFETPWKPYLLLVMKSTWWWWTCIDYMIPCCCVFVVWIRLDVDWTCMKFQNRAVVLNPKGLCWNPETWKLVGCSTVPLAIGQWEHFVSMHQNAQLK
jgi:hypothetical protein